MPIYKIFCKCEFLKFIAIIFFIADTIKMNSQAMQIQEESLDSPVRIYNADRSKVS